MDARDVGASTVVEVRALSKRYGAEGRKHDGSVTQALDRVSFAVACGEFFFMIYSNYRNIFS